MTDKNQREITRKQLLMLSWRVERDKKLKYRRTISEDIKTLLRGFNNFTSLEGNLELIENELSPRVDSLIAIIKKMLDDGNEEYARKRLEDLVELVSFWRAAEKRVLTPEEISIIKDTEVSLKMAGSAKETLKGYISATISQGAMFRETAPKLYDEMEEWENLIDGIDALSTPEAVKYAFSILSDVSEVREFLAKAVKSQSVQNNPRCLSLMRTVRAKILEWRALPGSIKISKETSKLDKKISKIKKDNFDKEAEYFSLIESYRNLADEYAEYIEKGELKDREKADGLQREMNALRDDIQQQLYLFAKSGQKDTMAYGRAKQLKDRYEILNSRMARIKVQPSKELYELIKWQCDEIVDAHDNGYLTLLDVEERLRYLNEIGDPYSITELILSNNRTALNAITAIVSNLMERILDVKKDVRSEKYDSELDLAKLSGVNLYENPDLSEFEAMGFEVTGEQKKETSSETAEPVLEENTPYPAVIDEDGQKDKEKN